MSIKRTKQTSYRGRDTGSESAWTSAKPQEPEPTYAEAVEGKPDESFVPYSMTSKFDKGALIAHSKFGKGIVVAVEGARIEVLFSDGKKKLGHAGT